TVNGTRFGILRPMRRVLPGLAGLLLLACAGPRASGALWALDEARLEGDLIYRQTEQQRAATARSFQLQVADESLAPESERPRRVRTWSRWSARCPPPRSTPTRRPPAPRSSTPQATRPWPWPSMRWQSWIVCAARRRWWPTSAGCTGERSACRVRT